MSCPAALLPSSLLHGKGSPQAAPRVTTDRLQGASPCQLCSSINALGWWGSGCCSAGDRWEWGRSLSRASSQEATGTASPRGDEGLGTHSFAGLAPASVASPQTVKLLTAPAAAEVSAPLAKLALPKSNFTSALFDDSSPNHQDCRNILNTEAPTLACTTELRLCDKLDNTVNIVCVLHIVSVAKQGSLAPYLPG